MTGRALHGRLLLLLSCAMLHSGALFAIVDCSICCIVFFVFFLFFPFLRENEFFLGFFRGIACGVVVASRGWSDHLVLQRAAGIVSSPLAIALVVCLDAAGGLTAIFVYSLSIEV